MDEIAPHGGNLPGLIPQVPPGMGVGGFPLTTAEVQVSESTQVHQLRNKVQDCRKLIQNLKDGGQRRNKGRQSTILVNYVKNTYLNKERWNILQ